MRILVVHPGASFSTADVFYGYAQAMREQGIDVRTYQLDAHIDRADQFYKYMYRSAKKQDPEVPKPTAADVLYLAGQSILERALRYNADFVLIMSAMFLHPDVTVLLRRAEIKYGLLFTESPYDDVQQMNVAQFANICWTNDKNSVAMIQEVNDNVHYLPHAWNPTVHRPEPDPEFDGLGHDVVFVGTGFLERVKLLNAIDWAGLGIDLGLYGTWELAGSKSKLQQYIVEHRPIHNKNAVEIYKRSKIGLNLHRQSMGFGRKAPQLPPGRAYSLNPRAYELAACGVFQISDPRPELAEKLPMVPTFETPKQLETLVTHFLQHPEDRNASIEAARSAVEEDTYQYRTVGLLKQIEEVLAGSRSKTAVGVS